MLSPDSVTQADTGHGRTVPSHDDDGFDGHALFAQDFREARALIVQRARSASRGTEGSSEVLANYLHDPALPITQLPTEVLLMVFQYAGRHKNDWIRLLPVCKYWAGLLLELVWFRPMLQLERAVRGIEAVLRQLHTLYDYRRWIKRLNLLFVTRQATDELLVLFEGCLNLERLTLVNCSKLTARLMIATLGGCARLQLIDMSGVSANEINDTMFHTLATNCPRLQGLYAPGCGNVLEAAVLELVEACPMLKRIKLSDNANITDVAVEQLAASCKYLVEIDLLGCTNVTDAGLARVFSDLEQLREFRISMNDNVLPLCMEPLVLHGPVLDRLRILDFTACINVTDKLVERFVAAAPRLRNVVLSKCHRITDASLRLLSSLGRSLHYIHLGHCGLITDWGVKDLVRACHRIQYIDLACCMQLTNESLVALAELPRLRRIGLVKCANITDRGLTELCTRRGPQDTLERVHLLYCTNLTVLPVLLLLRNCPKLTHLSLTGVLAFLRSDFTVYCRAPPPDFLPHQQQLFCVFSGNGVRQLRLYLLQIITNPVGVEISPDRLLLGPVMGVGGVVADGEPNPLANMNANVTVEPHGGMLDPIAEFVFPRFEGQIAAQERFRQEAGAGRPRGGEGANEGVPRGAGTAAAAAAAAAVTAAAAAAATTWMEEVEHHAQAMLQRQAGTPEEAAAMTQLVNLDTEPPIPGLIVNLRGDPRPHLLPDPLEDRLSDQNIRAFIAYLARAPLAPNVLAQLFEHMRPARPATRHDMYVRQQEYQMVREREARRQQFQRYFLLQGRSIEGITRDTLEQLMMDTAQEFGGDEVDADGDVEM